MTEYESLDRLNWSKLKLLERSPAHFKQGYGEDSSGFALGTAAHMAILEPERFATEYVVYPGRRAGKAWEAFEQEALDSGKAVLNQKEHDQACAMRDAVRKHPAASRYLSGGQAEVPLIWDLGQFECKGRADYINPLALVDLKSTKDASPKAFARACAQYGYFGQAAWYSDGHAIARKMRLPFVFVAVESSAPFIVTVFRVPAHVIEAGREQYLSLLAKLDACQRSGFWGGYVDGEVDLEIPKWMEEVNG